jgi:hypothetical protein
MIELESVRKRVATLWFVWTGILFSIMLIRHQAGAYDCASASCDPKTPWMWFTATFAPTLTVLAYSVLAPELPPVRPGLVTRYAYRWVLAFSIFYLAASSLPVVVVRQNPFLAMSDSYWIATLQAIVIPAIKRVFSSKKAQDVAADQESVQTHSAEPKS